MINVKLCKNCVHMEMTMNYLEDAELSESVECRHGNAVEEIDYVGGIHSYRMAQIMRDDDKLCGKSGTLYRVKEEEKPTVVTGGVIDG